MIDSIRDYRKLDKSDNKTVLKSQFSRTAVGANETTRSPRVAKTRICNTRCRALPSNVIWCHRRYPGQKAIKSEPCRLEVETRLGMKRIEGRKGRARGRREGVSGRGSWHRLYSFTRSFIVRTPPRGSTKPLAHSEPVTRPCGTRTRVCVHVRTHVRMYTFLFFVLSFPFVRIVLPLFVAVAVVVVVVVIVVVVVVVIVKVSYACAVMNGVR